MKIAVLKESRDGERRVAATPTLCAQWVKQGHEVAVETQAGIAANYTDEMYTLAGASIAPRVQVLNGSRLVLHVNPPTDAEIAELPEGVAFISMLYHRSNPAVADALNGRRVSAFSLDAIPRISRAQSMDVLSSQANLAGYKAVIKGAENLGKIFPMLMTAAGTITPAKVLIFGVGVAGLQAIATAKRLGAVVEATDVRPETKEQVESLGGKFIEVKGAEVGSEGGYAKEATEEYRQKQREAVNKSLAQADLVVTTAQVPGRKAPVLIDEEQLGMMKHGSVVVDMAAEQGGNCARTEAGKIIQVNGVTIIGATNLPSELPMNASELFAKNIDALLKLVAPKGELQFDMNDEIVQGCLVCHEGKVLLGETQKA
ncbi:MAG: Re/Si-specific NAD(P)(+) transhydrogenase subunit alpha [Bacteroidetes bacterium]|nr:Re/Si-specific NAD(P)(+) transhydrogenase subunit alpha [Bacteroidota bacterium]